MSEEEMIGALEKPIPDMSGARRSKATTGYGHIPIDWTHPLHKEPLVALDHYGIANQAYYSRPNGAVPESIPGVPKELYARHSIAEILIRINEWLRHSVVVKFFGGELEVYVEDAWRDPELQRHLYEDVFPELIHRWSGFTGLLMEERRKQFIALPSVHWAYPSPHVAGAVDLTLRWRQEGQLRFVPDVQLALGYEDGGVSERLYPDYYENRSKLTPDELEARRNRRAFVAIMTGAAFGDPTGMVVNPTEIFHWGTGDQLSALASGATAAYYSVATLPET